MTSTKDAIKIFEDDHIRNPPVKRRNPETGEEETVKLSADQCSQVKLYFMKPPITKLDATALSNLKECEHLAVSTNNIDKIVNLGGMEKLKILSIGRNKIKRFEMLEAIGDRIEQIWASYNLISSLSGLESCRALKHLYVGNNNISDLKEIFKLQSLPVLEEVVLHGNPIQDKIRKENGDLGFADAVLEILPKLKRLDGIAAVDWRTRIVEGNEQRLRSLFDQIDADGSGDLDIKEMQTALKDDAIRVEAMIPLAKCDSAFQEMDVDGSGSVDWEEFLEYFSTKKRPTLVNLGLA